MGTKLHSTGYDSIGPNIGSENSGDYDWNVWPKGTPAHFEGRVIFTFEDGTIVEYDIQERAYKQKYFF